MMIEDHSEFSEEERRPKILYRAFTVDPRELTVDSLSKTLVPGTVSADDPTKILDGNELGVYMSTNRTMIEAAYAHTSIGLFVPAPSFRDHGSTNTQGILLPQCGVVVEVDTKNLPIRKPKISSTLQGVYNNGFEGDEYIADSIPPQNYRVIKLILSRWANDSERMDVEVEGSDKQSLQLAIERIKAWFLKYEENAKKFAAFLITLTEAQRMNEFVIKKKWDQYLSS